MTFFEARAVSHTTGLHVRRSAWTADKWFILWRGTWFVFATGLTQPKPVRATDYTAADLNATDWTTVPAPLAACPVTPTEPLGGGPPGFPTGFPDGGSPPGFPPPPGGGGGGGSPSGSLPPLPPADPGDGITVTFAGVTPRNDGTDVAGVSFDDGPYSCDPSGPGVWEGTFTSGTLAPGSDAPTEIVWKVTVTKNPTGALPGDPGYLYFAVTLASLTTTDLVGDILVAFHTIAGAPHGSAISNSLTSGSSTFGYDGTATVN